MKVNDRLVIPSLDMYELLYVPNWYEVWTGHPYPLEPKPEDELSLRPCETRFERDDVD